jgi:hypothetical protein
VSELSLARLRAEPRAGGKCRTASILTVVAGSRSQRPPATSERPANVSLLASGRQENFELRRANEILKAASVFFEGELDPRRPT